MNTTRRPGTVAHRGMRLRRTFKGIQTPSLPSTLKGSGGTPVATRLIDDVQEILTVEAGEVHHVIIETISMEPEVSNAALLQVETLDRDGRRIPVPGWPHRSARVDEYAYLGSGDESNPALTQFSVTIPEGATTLKLTGRTWKAGVKTNAVGSLLTHRSGEQSPPFATELGTRIEWGADSLKLQVPIPAGSHEAQLDFLLSAGPTPSKSPVAIKLLDANGEELMPVESVPQHPKFGAFVTVECPANDQARSQQTIDLPPEARTLVLAGVPWGKKTATIIEDPLITFSAGSDVQSAFTALMETAQANSPLIIIDCTAPPLGHATLSLRPNNLTIEYAKRDATILFVPFGSVQDQPVVAGERMVQIDRALAPELIELIVEERQGAENIYVCSSFPSLECVTRMEYLGKLNWRTVYEVRDDMEEFNRVGYSKWYHPLLEHKMLRIADTTVTVSKALSRKMQSLHPGSSPVHTVPNGVAVTTLENSESLRTPENLDRRNASSTVGYVGHLTPSWFDWPLLISAARRLPDVHFQIIGHGIPENISLPPNIEYLGAMSHDELRPYAKSWRVGLIPFIPTPLTRGVDPNKIYEYFAWGLRVLSAPMGSVDDYPSTWVYRNEDEFVQQLTEALSTPMAKDELQSLADFAAQSTWGHRADTMLEIIRGGH